MNSLHIAYVAIAAIAWGETNCARPDLVFAHEPAAARTEFVPDRDDD